MKPRKLVWTEGLFVTQHHFQQLDRYHEWLSSERLRAALPYDWGVLEVEVDERALAAEQLKLNRLSVILPDGSPIEHGEGTGDPVPPRAFGTAFPAQVKSLDVFVALTHESDTMPNVDLDGKSGGVVRYMREQASVLDVNTGVGEHNLQYARPNLSILFGDERKDAFDAVRIAQITRASSGVPTLKESFIPPVLRVGASSYLVGRFRKLLATLAGKQRTLADSRRQRTAAAVEFQASDSAKFWLLNALNVSIPSISHVVDHATDHPEQAYLHLAQLIGHLCTFAVDGDPTTIPKFNYLELGDVFEPMFDRAHKLLEAVLAERFVEIPLTKREDGMFLGQITDSNLLRYTFFLAATWTVPEAQLRDRMPKLTKIASWSQIGAILNSAVNGLKMELEYTPPGALPIKPGVVFFKVVRTPEYWNDIAGTGTIAIYQPIDPQGVTLHLYAVDPTNLQ
ncbi:MAG TPA: type VI secretion system baseplate subunit TssK [Polyangiaceae bacterium]|nr:type VI secretion system baseplate subunit TssK [Polyangiaceae bacterium]